ncbi:hypothetical protein AS132_00620 [Photobacterium sanguinicancri]|nr:hypothetical protein AS132_00620 [Photobacterium sanguinicancri]
MDFVGATSHNAQSEVSVRMTNDNLLTSRILGGFLCVLSGSSFFMSIICNPSTVPTTKTTD